jgi:DNA-binding FrmR family transcriptional regulator
MTTALISAKSLNSPLDPTSEHVLPKNTTESNDGHTIHHHHEAIAKRLKRAEGHLRSVVLMIENGRDCVDIAQQLSAVEKAITQAKKTLIQDHLDHCLEDVVGSLSRQERQSIDEFKTITKYL